MTFADKKNAVVSTKAVHASDVDTLRKATLAEAASSSAEAASIVDFSSSIHSARGGVVVDATVQPPLLYSSADGKSFAETPIASIAEDLPAAPGTDPEITVTAPGSPVGDAPAPATSPTTGVDVAVAANG